MASFTVSIPSSSSTPSESPSTYSFQSSSPSAASASTRERRESTSSNGSIQRTNSLAITSLPKGFFAPQILSVLKDHFESYGEINQWIPLPGFGRILLVYYEEDHAEHAKRQCDPIVLHETDNRNEITLRVYRADPNPLVPRDSNAFHIPSESYLQPPELEKNFLISPPGSPPVGWEPIREDPPNAAPLADDLMAALRQLQLQEKRSSVEVLLDPLEGSGVGVYVEDCDMLINEDGEENVGEEDWVYGFWGVFSLCNDMTCYSISVPSYPDISARVLYNIWHHTSIVSFRIFTFSTLHFCISRVDPSLMYYTSPSLMPAPHSGVCCSILW